MTYQRTPFRDRAMTQEDAAKLQMHKMLTGSCCEGAPQGESCDSTVESAVADGKLLRMETDDAIRPQ